MTTPLRTAVIGMGLIGKRRAEMAVQSPRSRLAAIVDVHLDALRPLAAQWQCDVASDWRAVIARADIDVIVIATPNALLTEIGIAALRAGKHVLIEKPMGRNLQDARALAAATVESGKCFKVGFNHRYHPALQQAHTMFRDGAIGALINLRAVYGHGGRAGYENEWRGNAQLAGGGELTDQGVHLADLLCWFAGVPHEAFAYLQTAVWPIAPMEDNALCSFRYANGVLASFHTSWTQWKNKFSFEIFGTDGALLINGLGKSYGQETLTCWRRKPEGGVPDEQIWRFDGPDASWELEWDDFCRGIQESTDYWGTATDGVHVMHMIDALYRSSTAGAPCLLA